MAQFDPYVPDATRVSGVRTIGDSITSTRIKPDVADEIFSYQPNSNAVGLILRKARSKRKVSQYMFYILEKDPLLRRTAINLAAGYDADDVSIVVDDGAVGYNRAVAKNMNTNERFLIQSVSSNTWTIGQRGIGGTQMPMADNDPILVLGPAYPEFADVGTAISVKEDAKYNYTETTRTPMTFSERNLNSDLFGGKDMTTEQKWQTVEHTKSIEYKNIWGVRDSITDPVDATPLTFMGGIHYYVQDENEWNINGIPFNEGNLTEYLEVFMEHGRGGRNGSKTKYVICGARFITILEDTMKDRLRYVPSAAVYGLDANVYKSFHGRLIFVPHPLLENEDADKAFALDFNHLRYVYHQGLDTALLKNRQSPGRTGVTHEWRTDHSIEVQLPAAHGYWHGLPI